MITQQTSDAEYARLQAKVATGVFSEAEYECLWAAARKPEPEPEAGL